MAWTRLAAPLNSGLTIIQEEVTLVDTDTAYTSEIPEDIQGLMTPDSSAARKVLVSFNASAVTGTNLDISVQGQWASGGTRVQLLDAVVADITATGENSAIFDLNAYPAAWYSFAALSDADESSNTLTVTLVIPPKTRD